MKHYIFLILFSFPLFIIAQETIAVNYQEWDFKSHPEGNQLRSKEEGVWIDNVSVPEMDVYPAEGKHKTDKAMIICPGGGLYFLAYEKEGVKLAKKLASNGITAVVLKYRTYPREGSVIQWTETMWKNPQMAIDSAKIILPYSTKDALSAIEQIREKSTNYAVSPNKIGLMGFSAGGAVTMQAAYTASPKNQPNYIAPIYPWMVIVDQQKVPNNLPPAFISCANDDPLELAEPSVQIYRDWIASGAKAELHMFSTGGHGYGMNPMNAPVDRWSQLLIDWILSL